MGTSCERNSSYSFVMIVLNFAYAGFQAGPTFPTFPYFFFCVPTFPYFFLKMPYYPYFLVEKCLKWPKIVIFFLARSKFVKIGST